MSTYSASLSPDAAALHPHLLLQIPRESSEPVASTSCDLFVLLRVPPGLIVDRYELQRLHRAGRLGTYDEESAGKGSLRVLGEGDLEAPVWKVETNEGGGAAALLLRLREGKGKQRDEQRSEDVSADIPLHVRYQLPVEERWGENGERLDMVDVELEWPSVFWACEGRPEPALSSLPSCPAPSLPPNLSFPFLSSSSLHYLSPNVSSSSSTCPPSLPPPLVVPHPTGVASDLPLVETVTMAAVWGCFIWLAWVSVSVWRRSPPEAAEEGRRAKRQ
ncbi:hypothetical protein JCM10213_002229 [Rhodosporidiobolus nylandii]